MSAPTSAYDTRLLKRKTSPAENVQLAKIISEYADYTAAKSLFHLDKVLKPKDISTLQQFFVGLVFPGGSNEIYHTSRLGNTKYRGYKVILDAGLNCKAEKPLFQTQGGIASKLNVLDNSILLRAWFKSSFYNDTTGHTVNIADSLNLNNVISTLLGTIAANVSKTYSGDIIPIPATMIFYVGKTYVITLTATNSEGSITSESLSLMPAAAAVNLKYGSTLDAAIVSQSASTVYINRRISDAIASSGVIFFGNSDATTYASAAYYLSPTANEYGRYKYYRVTGSYGSVTEIGEIVSRHQDIYHYYSTISDGDAISYSPVERVLYYEVEITPPDSDFENRTYFSGSFADSQHAPQGYYVKADRSTSIYVGSDGSAMVFVGNEL